MLVDAGFADVRVVEKRAASSSKTGRERRGLRRQRERHGDQAVDFCKGVVRVIHVRRLRGFGVRRGFRSVRVRVARGAAAAALVVAPAERSSPSANTTRGTRTKEDRGRVRPAPEPEPAKEEKAGC